MRCACSAECAPSYRIPDKKKPHFGQSSRSQAADQVIFSIKSLQSRFATSTSLNASTYKPLALFGAEFFSIFQPFFSHIPFLQQVCHIRPYSFIAIVTIIVHNPTRKFTHALEHGASGLGGLAAEVEMRSFRKQTQRALMIAATAGVSACFSPSAHGYSDYLVDPAWGGAQGAAGLGYLGVWTSVTSAFTASTSLQGGSSMTNPNRLFIMPGTYNVGTTFLKFSHSNVDLIGMDTVTGNNSDVVITSTLDSGYNTGSATIGTSNSATLMLTGSNICVANLTIANSTDTPYIVGSAHMAESPTGSFATGQSQTASDPAVALLSQGDCQVYSNVSILGFQDSLYLKGGRTYFTNSYISGDDDFIFANGTSIFNNDVINNDGNHTGGSITAASTDKRTSNGFVFMNSQITENSVQNSVIDPNGGAVSQSTMNAWTASSYNFYLGRPWGWQQAGGDAAVVYMNDQINTLNLNSAGWLNWDSTELNASNGKNGGNPGEDSRFATYGDTDDNSNALNTSNYVSWSHTLSSTQASMYSIANIFTFDANLPNGGWFGAGYPAGDNAPGSGLPDTNPNYSFPAFWGPRNINNETANDNITGNPTAYINPTWNETTVTTFDPTIQLATVPEPGTISLAVAVGLFALERRRRKPLS
jgi:pectin methylesterase-like acyl-CoA thioesterase